MVPPRERLILRLLGDLSSWWLQAYRRPRSFLLTLVILPLVIVVIATYQISVSLWRQQALHNLGVTSHLAAQILDETLNDTIRFEQLIAAQPGFGEALRGHDRAQLTRILQASLPFVPNIDLAMVISPQGEVVASYPSQAGGLGRDVSGEDVFRGAREGGWHPYVSAVYVRDGEEMEKVVGVALPIVSNKTVVGILQLQHRVETVKSWLQKIRVEPAGFLYVVDHHDQLVVHPFQVLPGRPKVVADWPPVAHRVAPRGDTLIFRGGPDAKRWLAGIYPISTTGWRAIAVQPEREVLRPLRRVFFVLGLLIALLLVLVISATLRWAQLQALSLRLLNQNAKLLKKLQQRQTLERGERSQQSKGGAGA